MKINKVLLLFNSFLLVAAAFLAGLPFLTLGWEFAGEVWKTLWPAGPFFVLLAVLVNAFVLSNRRLYLMAEEERWADLVDYLKTAFYEKSRGRRGRHLNGYRLKVFIPAAFLAGRSGELEELEAFLKKHQPGLMGRFFLPLGMRRIILRDPQGMEEYFRGALTLRGIRRRKWCLWIYALSLIQLGEGRRAREILTGLSSAGQPLLNLLALYLLHLTGPLEQAGNNHRGQPPAAPEKPRIRRLLKALPPGRFEALKSRAGDDLLLFSLSRLLDEAYAWLTSQKEPGNPEKAV
ncbi:MAG: hypothetical protein LBQ61_05575 [Spirochaetales bacterium]|nr:hypothetical protein [Spirochaetales bacterium]